MTPTPEHENILEDIKQLWEKIPLETRQSFRDQMMKASHIDDGALAVAVTNIQAELYATHHMEPAGTDNIHVFRNDAETLISHAVRKDVVEVKYRDPEQPDWFNDLSEENKIKALKIVDGGE